MASSESNSQESRRSINERQELQNLAQIKIARAMKRVSYHLAKTDSQNELNLGSAEQALSFSKPESTDRTAENSSTTKVFFKNVPKNLSVEEVTEFLAALGPISHLRVPFSVQKAKNMGYGYVAFKEEDINLWLISQNPAIYFLDKRIIFSKHQNSLKRIGKRNKKLELMAQSASKVNKQQKNPPAALEIAQIRLRDEALSLAYLPSTVHPEGGEQTETHLHQFRPTQRNYFSGSGYRSELLHLSNNIRLRVLTWQRYGISTNAIARG
jgi:RNA recognition motif-containing protein